MAADTEHEVRADQVRRFIELDGLETFLKQLLYAADEDDRLLSAISWDGLAVRESGPMRKTCGELLDVLWPSDQDTETAEFNVAYAQSGMLTASVFQWLTTSEGQAFCQREAQRQLDVARGLLRKHGLEAVLGGGGDDA